MDVGGGSVRVGVFVFMFLFVFVILALAAIVIVPFLILRPRKEIYVLRAFEAARVAKSSISESISASGKPNVSRKEHPPRRPPDKRSLRQGAAPFGEIRRILLACYSSRGSAPAHG